MKAFDAPDIFPSLNMEKNFIEFLSKRGASEGSIKEKAHFLYDTALKILNQKEM